MKRIFLHSICLIFAGIFLTIGGGVNVADYCCDLCAQHRQSLFSAQSCCADIHANHSHHEPIAKNCCKSHQTADCKSVVNDENACRLYWLSVDNLTIDHAVSFDFFAAVIAEITDLVPDFSAKPTLFEQTVFSNAPPLSGREILLHSSLLII